MTDFTLYRRGKEEKYGSFVAESIEAKKWVRHNITSFIDGVDVIFFHIQGNENVEEIVRELEEDNSFRVVQL